MTVWNRRSRKMNGLSRQERTVLHFVDKHFPTEQFKAKELFTHCLGFSYQSVVTTCQRLMSAGYLEVIQEATRNTPQVLKRTDKPVK